MCVPLPLASAPGGSITGVTGEGARVQLPPPPRLKAAVDALGLGKAIGYLRMLQVLVLEDTQLSRIVGCLSASYGMGIDQLRRWASARLSATCACCRYWWLCQ